MKAITNEPIAPLLFKLTLPMLLAITSMMLLPLIDAYFVGKLGLKQLAAISFTLPISGLIINVALGLGMAISSIVSRLVGEGNHKQVARLISDSYIAVFFLAIFIAVIGFFNRQQIFASMGADTEVLIYIDEFMSIWFFGVPIFMFSIIFSGTFRALGDTKTSAFISLSATIANMILDPILIFGFGPIPALGVTGAAYATVISLVFSFSTGFFLLYSKEKVLLFSSLKADHFLMNLRRLSKIAVNTVSANLMTPFAATIMTVMIAEYGSSAVAGFGVGSRIEMLLLLAIFALSSTLPMFVGQNLGAQRKDRVFTAVTGSLKLSLVLQLIIYAFIFFAAPYIAVGFSDNAQAIEVTTLFLRILPLTYGCHGIVILVTVCLNVLHKPGLALLLSIIRMFVLYIPLAWIGSYFAGIEGMFIGATIGNICASLIAYAAIKNVFHKQNIKR